MPFFFTNSGTARVWFLPALSAVCSCPHLLVGPGRTRPSGCTANILAADGRRALVFFGFYLLLGAGTLRRRWLGSCISARADEHDQAGENIRPQPTGPFSSVAFLHGVQAHDHEDDVWPVQYTEEIHVRCGAHESGRKMNCPVVPMRESAMLVYSSPKTKTGAAP